MFIENCDRLP